MTQPREPWQEGFRKQAERLAELAQADKSNEPEADRLRIALNESLSLMLSYQRRWADEFLQNLEL